MTTKADFTPEEWTSVLQGPPAPGCYVVVATRGGMFRETLAMSKAYAEARAAHGESELLDEIVAARPSTDHTRYHSPEELRDTVLERLRTAVALLAARATPEEVDGYRRFVVALAERVAAAHREDDEDVSPAEAEAVERIAERAGHDAAAVLSLRVRRARENGQGRPQAATTDVAGE